MLETLLVSKKEISVAAGPPIWNEITVYHTHFQANLKGIGAHVSFQGASSKLHRMNLLRFEWLKENQQDLPKSRFSARQQEPRTPALIDTAEYSAYVSVHADIRCCTPVAILHYPIVLLDKPRGRPTG
jgi:hypothetical protein